MIRCVTVADMGDAEIRVVLEGPDGGGKSTLARDVCDATGLRLQEGAGPPRGPGEIESRTARYLEMDGVVFDRHPAVSQPIYAHLRGEALSPDMRELVQRFYRTPHLVVYCRSVTSDRHVVKAYEDPGHVRAVTQRYPELVSRYDEWAAYRADLQYSIDPTPTVRPMPMSPARVIDRCLEAVNAGRGDRPPAKLTKLGDVLEQVVTVLAGQVSQYAWALSVPARSWIDSLPRVRPQ